MKTSNKDNFDIHQKLREQKSSWGYLHAVGEHQANVNYEFITNFIGETEYALYQRIDSYFVLVDFFKNYEEACVEAKEIIVSNSQLRQLFSIN